jgi:hypothetical protein
MAIYFTKSPLLINSPRFEGTSRMDALSLKEVLKSRVSLSWMKASRGIANSAQHFLQRRGGKRSQWTPRIPGRDVTIISPESIDAPPANERNTALVIIAAICLSALVIGYVGYCFYATAEKLRETSDRTGINLQR